MKNKLLLESSNCYRHKDAKVEDVREPTGIHMQNQSKSTTVHICLQKKINTVYFYLMARCRFSSPCPNASLILYCLVSYALYKESGGEWIYSKCTARTKYYYCTSFICCVQTVILLQQLNCYTVRYTSQVSSLTETVQSR